MQRIYFILIFFFNVAHLQASTLTAVCDGLKGVRIDYNDKKFETIEDGIPNSAPTIIFNTNKRTVTYVIKDAAGRPLTVEGDILQIGEGRLSFVGIIDEVPALFSLYRPEGVLYVTEHARHSPLIKPDQPPKAKLFYSKCEVSIER